MNGTLCDASQLEPAPAPTLPSSPLPSRGPSTVEEGFRRFEVGVQDWFRKLVHQEPPVAPTVEAPEPSAQESSAAPELQA